MAIGALLQAKVPIKVALHAMLTTLELHQYKGHTQTEISLERLSVLIGPNASGKTSALEALRWLALASEARAGIVFAGAEWLLRHGATEPTRLRVSGLTAGISWQFGVSLPSDGDWTQAKDEWRREPDEGDEDSASSALPPEVSALKSATLLRLDAKRLAEPSYSEEERPRLGEDGYGLATVLSTLKLSSTERFHELEAAARRIVPSLRRIGFKRTRIEQQAPRALSLEGQKVLVPEKRVLMGDELVLDFTDATGLPAHAASEGTLLVLGLLAALYSPADPRLLLLDDLDRALHPNAQQDLIAGLFAALDAMPDAQILATTHSPYLVDALQPEQVVVLARGRDDKIAARRLSEHPKAHLLDTLTTGEFWTAEGEEWVTNP